MTKDEVLAWFGEQCVHRPNDELYFAAYSMNLSFVIRSGQLTVFSNGSPVLQRFLSKTTLQLSPIGIDESDLCAFAWNHARFWFWVLGDWSAFNSFCPRYQERDWDVIITMTDDYVSDNLAYAFEGEASYEQVFDAVLANGGL